MASCFKLQAETASRITSTDNMIDRDEDMFGLEQEQFGNNNVGVFGDIYKRGFTDEDESYSETEESSEESEFYVDKEIRMEMRVKKRRRMERWKKMWKVKKSHKVCTAGLTVSITRKMNMRAKATAIRAIQATNLDCLSPGLSITNAKPVKAVAH